MPWPTRPWATCRGLRSSALSEPGEVHDPQLRGGRHGARALRCGHGSLQERLQLFKIEKILYISGLEEVDEAASHVLLGVSHLHDDVATGVINYLADMWRDVSGSHGGRALLWWKARDGGRSPSQQPLIRRVSRPFMI